MKKQLPFVAFSLALLGLSSCASLEHLTDDRSRLEDDEVYWNRQELFYSPIAANADPYVLGEDDYFNPNSIPNANQLNGGRNPNAFWSPNLGWQLSYGLSPFSNYYNGFDYGFNSYGSYGYGNSYYSPWGYSTYNPYGSSWGYNPNGYLSYGGYGSGFGWGGYNPYYGGGYNGGGWGSGWNNNTGGSNENGANVTHIHRNPISVGQSNGSGYHGGRLQKQVVAGLAVESKEPVSSFQIAGRSVGVVGGKTTEYNTGRGFSNGATYEDDYHSGSRNYGNTNTGNSNQFNSSTSRDQSNGAGSNNNSTGKGSSSPSYSAPSRSSSAPSYSAPSHSAPSRSNSAPSNPAPSRSSGSSPSKGGGGGGSAPGKSGGRK
ncbi:MAG: hypothetical protein RIR06_1901 [Bacteroidota bacterium]|jgi:hypothetical protein